MQHAICDVVLRGSSGISFDRFEIEFSSAVFRRLNLINRWRKGVETAVPGEEATPATSFRKSPTLNPGNSSPNRDSNPPYSLGHTRKVGKQACSLLRHLWSHKDLLWQLDVLAHCHRSCVSSHPVTVCWHLADQSSETQYNIITRTHCNNGREKLMLHRDTTMHHRQTIVRHRDTPLYIIDTP